MTDVQIHFSINKPLSGVSAGDYFMDIMGATDGVWSKEDPAIPVVAGDTIYYWILVFVNGGGYQKTDLSGVVAGNEPTTTPVPDTTTQKVTTTATTTTSTTTTTTTTTPGPQFPRPQLEQMVPMGFRMWIKDFEGLEHVGFHFSVNEELSGVDYGQENIEIDAASSDGTWSHSWANIRLQDGDTVNYWYYLVVDKHGFQFTENSWTIGETIPIGSTTTTSPGTTIPDILSVTESNIGKYFAPGQLIFEDNFDFFDEYTWENEITLGGGGNWEFQFYTHNRTNSYTRDGNLFLKATLTEDAFGEEFLTSQIMDVWSGSPGSECTSNAFYGCFRVGTPTNMINPIMSGRLRSAKSFTFMYGKVEARARLPVGDWLWPAIWLLPVKSKYGQWPASGEIDIMESRGNLEYSKDGMDIGVNQFGSTLQFGGGYPLNGYEKAHCDYNLPGGAGFHEDFHTFGLDWTPTYLAFSIDGVGYCKNEPLYRT
ncbi:beta-1,3-glucan-binding protein isoform X3 [Eurytemora carolleeae]|uniref:beta-1,3-glucan-binding protein isoform X3 n=1 Tax=Eurytemora carolleeae TaxID=1294199 RepID=UPI000C782B7B|nr:beta-1,3-glucan-binding protein isoform X3 [Eurytemora carolleeae]|eukprot:XP_023340736.1 beta-1,3-glucan-binding protein-like isoform X3 [Eurytemora affinis]